MRDKRRTPLQHVDLARLATAQHGVISASQLDRLGYSRSAVSRWDQAGHLHHLHRGVYAVGHTDLEHKAG